LVSTIPVKSVRSDPASLRLCPPPARPSHYGVAPIRQSAHRVPGALGPALSAVAGEWSSTSHQRPATGRAERCSGCGSLIVLSMPLYKPSRQRRAALAGSAQRRTASPSLLAIRRKAFGNRAREALHAARSASMESYLWRLEEQVLSIPLAGIFGFRQIGSQVGRWPR